jgi:hypothetical protein
MVPQGKSKAKKGGESEDEDDEEQYDEEIDSALYGEESEDLEKLAESSSDQEMQSDIDSVEDHAQGVIKMKKVIPAGNKSGQPGQQKKKQLGGSKRR